LGCQFGRSPLCKEVDHTGHSVATDPCGAFSEHGCAGIEDDVVKEIADFVKDTDHH
jgi:hypothetical protein